MKIKIFKLIMFFNFLPIIVFLATLFLINLILTGKVDNNDKSFTQSSESLKLEIESRNNLATVSNKPTFTKVKNLIETPNSSTSIELWQKEKGIIGNSRNRLFLSGPELFQPVTLQYQDNPINILFVGDSYSNGQFGNLNESTYPRLLENQLNSESPGAYKVSVLANAKSSFLRQSDWLSKERLVRYQPDAIILTYTAGRLIPHFYEKKYCKQYNTCIKDGESDLYNDALANDYESATTKYRIIMCLESESTFLGAVFRKILYPYLTNLAEFLAVKYCTYDKIKRGFDRPTDRDPSYYKDPTTSPYFDDFLEYLANSNSAIEQYNKERTKAGKAPVKKYMINLTWIKEHFYPPVAGRKSYSGALIKAYQAYGYQEIPNINARNHVLTQDYTKLGNVQGGDQANGICFYGCEISESQMAQNIKNYEKGVLNNPLVYRFGSQLHTAFAADLDIFLKNEFKPKSNFPITVENILDEYGPWFISYKKIDTNNFAYGNYDLNLSGNTYCGRINHPHTLFSINNSFFKEGDNINIGYSEGEISELIIVVERSKASGERFLSEAYSIKSKEELVINYKSDITSIYLGDRSKNCIEKGNALPKFTVILSKD